MVYFRLFPAVLFWFEHAARCMLVVNYFILYEGVHYGQQRSNPIGRGSGITGVCLPSLGAGKVVCTVTSIKCLVVFLL